MDEAQRLNSDCIELLRHLHDDPKTKFALLYVGGDGCWEVLSREPMLRSRVFRRLPFRPLTAEEIPALMRDYHPIYTGADDALLRQIDELYGPCATGPPSPTPPPDCARPPDGPASTPRSSTTPSPSSVAASMPETAPAAHVLNRDLPPGPRLVFVRNPGDDHLSITTSFGPIYTGSCGPT